MKNIDNKNLTKKQAIKSFIGLVVCITLLISMITIFTAQIKSAHALFFHGIYIGDRDTIENYFLEINVARATRFCLWSSVRGTGNSSILAPWSGHRTRRANMDLQVEMSFIDVKINGLNPVILTTICVDVASGNNRFWNNGTVGYYINPQTITISLSNNFFVAIRYRYNIPDSAFNRFNMAVRHNGGNFPALGGSTFGNRATTLILNIPDTRVYAENVSTSYVDPNSPFFNINFGNTGENLQRPPDDIGTEGEALSLWQSFLRWATSVFGISALAVTAILVGIGVVMAITLLRK